MRGGQNKNSGMRPQFNPRRGFFYPIPHPNLQPRDEEEESDEEPPPVQKAETAFLVLVPLHLGHFILPLFSEIFSSSSNLCPQSIQ
jgi:hypothetical protein